MRDSLTLGLVSGFMGNLAKGLFNLITWKSKNNEVLYSHIAASMFFRPRRIKKRGSLFVGSLADLTAGSILGIPLVYLLKKTGKDNYWVKGAGFGALLWTLLYGAGHNFNLFLFKPKKSRSSLLAFIEHLLFGVVTAEVAVKLADPGTFPDDDADYDFGF